MKKAAIKIAALPALSPADATQQARTALREWLDRDLGVNKQSRAPRHWVEIKERLMASEEMGDAWADLMQLGAKPIGIAAAAQDAYRATVEELARPDRKAEQREIRSIAALARRLAAAIEKSPLPKGSRMHLALGYPPNPPLNVELGWSQVHEEAHVAPVLVVSEFLRDVAELAEGHLLALPPRATIRHRTKAVTPTFVRRLNFVLTRRYGGLHKPATVAEITNASLALESPINSKDVLSFLKDAPPAFLPQLSGTKIAR